MSIPDPSKLDAIGHAMVAAAPERWRKITLTATTAADMTSAQVSVDMQDGTVHNTSKLDRDGVLAISGLRKSMYQEGKGAWYNATITVDESGKILADFDYDNAPFGGIADDDDPDSEGDAEPDLLIEDNEMYPRDLEFLPDWHPARSP